MRPAEIADHEPVVGTWLLDERPGVLGQQAAALLAIEELIETDEAVAAHQVAVVLEVKPPSASCRRTQSR